MFIKKTLETIQKFNMLFNEKNEKINTIIVGFSGGSDSTSLLHFLNKNIKGVKICAAHINHRLRENESERDLKFVEKICTKLNIKLFIKEVNVKEESKKRKMSIEECARNIRYSFFNELLNNRNDTHIATAHTLSDSCETIILNLTRGCGIKGICGIPPKRKYIIRPFIRITKDEILKYIKSNDLEFVEDSTNFSLDYSRNKIRTIVVPALKKINPAFETKCLDFLKIMSDNKKFVEETTNIEFKEFSKCNCDVNFLENKPKIIKSSIIKRKIEEFSNNIGKKHIEIMISIIKNKKGILTLPGRKKIFIENNKIMLKSEEEKNTEELTKKLKSFKISKVDFENFNEDKIKNVLDKFDLKEQNIQYIFRNKLPGDNFAPLNRNCTKKLRKFFNEMKINFGNRKNLVLLANGSEVVWIESIGVSDKYKINENTKNIGIIYVDL